MTSHVEQCRDHAVWQVLTEANQIISNLPPLAEFLGLERVVTVIRHVERVLNRVDPVLVSISQLDLIHQHLTNILHQLDAYLSSSNDQYVYNAESYADQLVISAQPIWSTITADDVAAVRADITAFRQSARTHTNNLSKEVAQFRNDLRLVGEERDNLRAEIDEQRGRLDTAIAEYQMQFSQSQETRARDDETARAVRRQEHEELAREGRAKMEETAKRAQEDRQSFLADAREKIAEVDRLGEDARNKQIATGDHMLQEMEELKSKAARVVGVIGNIGITGDYQNSASQEKRQAFWWAVAALTFFLAAVVAAAVFLTTGTENLDASGTARRIALSLIVGAPATFCVTQAREHRSAERRSRSLELELASLDPFIADLPEAYQQAMKADLASRYFRGNDNTVGPVEVESWLDRIRKSKNDPES